MKKSYYPNRSIRDYDAEILLAPKPPNDMIWVIIMTVLSLVTVTWMFVHFIVRPTENIAFVIITLAISFAMMIFGIQKVVSRSNQRRKFSANGGYTSSGKDYKKSRSEILTIAALLFLNALICVIVILFIADEGLRAFSVSSAAFSLPIFALNTNNLLINPGIGINAGIDRLILAEGRFYSAGYEVDSRGLTVKTKEKLTDPSIKQVAVVFHKDGQEVGHDTLKTQDYLYLTELLGGVQ
jgi:hypothetical protein